MSHTTLRKGAGAPSFCWQCNLQLHRAPGRGLGLFYFAIVRGPDGFEHRVHGDCLQQAVNDGCKFVPEPETVR